jgi:hypothetical protein
MRPSTIPRHDAQPKTAKADVAIAQNLNLLFIIVILLSLVRKLGNQVSVIVH